MSLFLITFLGIYGAMHAYAFVRLRSAFAMGGGAAVVMAGVMLFGIAAPVLVRLAEHGGFERTALAIAWSGYCWMGAFFIFFSLLLAVDLLRGGIILTGRLIPAWHLPVPTLRITCEGTLILALAAATYALFEARRLTVEHLTIPTDKLSADIPRLRIVQISDVHIGLLHREARLKAVVAAIRQAAPDILVSTGDLVDGRLSREEVLAHQNRLALLLNEAKPPLGAFAVTGNHDFYAGINQALDFTRNAGFRILRNETVTLPTGVSITGVDDPAGRAMGLSPKLPGEKALLEAVPKGNYRVLLKHRPVLEAERDNRFDLQLSGHVHKGQIFPFNLLVRLQFPIPTGTTPLPGGSMIHVSRGTGTWGPPMRLFAPPEITVIDLIRT